MNTMPSAFFDDLQDLPNRCPDFFIVGGPKCGTTSLFDWLAQHPDTYLVAKEPNFLSRDIYDARDVPGALADWTAYLGRLCPPEAAGLLTGESTPRYLYSDLALDILSRHTAQPKAIAVLRNPIDLVFSLHGQMVRQGVERDTDFQSAWARAVTKGSGADAWTTDDGVMDRRLDYPMYGRLGARLAAFHAAIPEDRRHVLILEEGLSKDPDAVFAELLAFLGLPPARIDLARSNKRVELRFPALHRGLVQVRDGVRRLGQLLGLNMAPNRNGKGTGLLALVMRFNSSTSNQPKLEPAMRAELAAFFASEVASVEAELKRPMLAWTDWSKGDAA